MTEIKYIARVYVVGPRNMFSADHCEVRGRDEIAAREGAFE